MPQTIYSQPLNISEMPITPSKSRPEGCDTILFKGWMDGTNFVLKVPDEAVASLVFDTDKNGHKFSRVIAQTADEPVITKSFGKDGVVYTNIDLGKVAVIPCVMGKDRKWHRV